MEKENLLLKSYEELNDFLMDGYQCANTKLDFKEWSLRMHKTTVLLMDDIAKVIDVN